MNNIVSLIKSSFPNVSTRSTKYGNLIVTNTPDSRDNTVQYGFYFHPDGIRVRRMITSLYMSPRYYQLNRNTHTNEWPAFNSEEAAVSYFTNYINNIDNYVY